MFVVAADGVSGITIQVYTHAHGRMRKYLDGFPFDAIDPKIVKQKSTKEIRPGSIIIARTKNNFLRLEKKEFYFEESARSAFSGKLKRLPNVRLYKKQQQQEQPTVSLLDELIAAQTPELVQALLYSSDNQPQKRNREEEDDVCESKAPECSICFEEKLDAVLPCGHPFHRHCIERTRDNDGADYTCAICRKRTRTIHKLFI